MLIVNKAVLLALLAAFTMLFAEALDAQAKFALVIGNGNYTGISRLNNPVNDANDMEAALRDLGFTVDKLLDASRVDMENAVARLKNRLSVANDSYGFLFYAGHGVQSGGVNYLIPVDAIIPSENYLRDRTVSVQTMMDELNDAGNALNIVVLDACRDNPYSWARTTSRGLTVLSNQPADSIIVYATSAGSTAADGTGRNGLFTEHLLTHLRKPGIEVSEVFRLTMSDVAQASGNQQRPAVYNQFPGLAYLGSLPAPVPMVTNVAVSPFSVTVSSGSTQQFAAIVTGTTDNPPQTVTWTLTGGTAGTSISPNGLLTIGPNQPPGTFVVTATSTADTSRSATAIVTVPQPVPTVANVTVSPNTATVNIGSTQQFAALVTGTNNPSQTVTWAVSGGTAGTSISPNGLLTVGPNQIPGTLTVMATSTADTSRSATAIVTVPQPAPAAVTPQPAPPPAPAPAVTSEPIPEGLQYRVNASSVTITGYTGNSANVNIPAQIQGLPVTGIGERAFAGNNRLNSINIPYSVTFISGWAFQNCSSLTNITIPYSVTFIGNLAFSGCGSLTNITIPSSVMSIGNSAFSGCGNLTSITLPSSVTSIGNSAFSGCGNLISITLPSSVTSIGAWVFAGCGNLTSITIPSSVTSIDREAFSGCNSLTSVTIPSSVTSIGVSAFSGCNSLTSVTIPSSVTSIGSSAFSGWTSRQTINIQGRANRATADSAWGADWRNECNARIVYTR